jgi:hypothetical protein
VGAVTFVAGVAGEVGVDALGDFAEEGFEVEGRRGGDSGGFGEWSGGGGGGGGAVELGDAVVPLVELDIEDADLANVAGLEAVELSAEAGKGGFVRGEGGAEGVELGAAVGKLGLFRGGDAEEGAGFWERAGHAAGWMIERGFPDGRRRQRDVAFWDSPERGDVVILRRMKNILQHIELTLTAVGVVVVVVVYFLCRQMNPWKATAVCAVLVGVVHGFIFYSVRSAQREARKKNVFSIRGMLDNMVKNELNVQLYPGDVHEEDWRDAAQRAVWEIQARLNFIESDSFRTKLNRASVAGLDEASAFDA